MNIRALQLSRTIKVMFTALAASALMACGGSDSTPEITNNDPGPVTMVDLEFVVQSHDGALLEGVTLALGEETVGSDDKGHASFNIPATDEVVVTARMDGYITQAVTVPAEEDAITSIRLAPVKQTLSISAIEDGRVISANDLGARITFPDNAFVTPDGSPASGSATVQVTPWDIAGAELNAMPGNGQALDIAGERVELISAGMITVDVYNAAGDYLQLAPGATAEIQMDLPLASINNQALSIGSTIPMWHFDEAQGLWVEYEEPGTVVASATSPVGLAVYAEVSHFSTWNWDFKLENGGSISVECRLEDDSTVPCAVTAEITLADGSTFTRNGYLPSGGATIINMPVTADIEWYATSAGGMLGRESSDMSADVIIALSEPATSNAVQCVLSDATPVACSVTLSDGINSRTQTIPSQGALVITDWAGLSDASILNWSAETFGSVVFEQQNVLGQGATTSDISESVTLTLTTTPIEEVQVSCAAINGTVVPCILDVSTTLLNGDPFTASHNISVDGDIIPVPADATLLHWSATSDGNFSQGGQFVELSGSTDTGLVTNLTLVLDNATVQGPAAQSIELRCTNGVGASATSCDIDVSTENAVTGFGLLVSFDAVPVGDFQTVQFLDGTPENTWIQISVSGDDGSLANMFPTYSSLTDGQQIDAELLTP